VNISADNSGAGATPASLDLSNSAIRLRRSEPCRYSNSPPQTHQLPSDRRLLSFGMGCGLYCAIARGLAVAGTSR
jgi:hypothetical protein